jgi:hypothetical protein
MVAAVFIGPIVRVLADIPYLDQVNWIRGLMPLCLVLATLAGVGVDGMLHSWERPLVRVWPLGGFIAAAVCLGALWFFGRTGGLPSFGHSFAEHVRAESFVWPVIGTAVGLLVGAVVLWQPRWRVAGAGVLVLAEIAVLLSAGAILISSSSNGYPPTKAVKTLQRVVGDARVGTGLTAGGSCPLGITPDANDLYGIHEFNLYDATLPKAYFSQWRSETHTSAGSVIFDVFCPDVATLSEARQFGIGYLLEPVGVAAPPGTRLVATLPVPNPDPGNPIKKPPVDEDLYSVPHSSVATLTTHSGGSSVTLTSPASNPAQLDVDTHSRSAGVLRVRVSNVPGWHATIDGRPLALEGSSVFELRAQIPAGAHHMQFRYWPSLLSAGLVLALVVAVALGAAVIFDWRRRRQRRLSSP